MRKGLQYRYTSKYNRVTNYRENIQQYNDGQNYVNAHGEYHKYEPIEIVTKNPHSPELRAQRGEGEYISMKTPSRTYEQRNAINKQIEEIKRDMAKNEVDLMDLFSPYQP